MNINLIPAAIMLMLLFGGSQAFALEKDISDQSVSYRYGTAFKEPAVAGGRNIQKNILNFSHFNTDSLGSNFFNIDSLFSHANDPKKNGTGGATEFYGLYRRTWSFSKVTGGDFSWGPIRDVTLNMGGDMNTKDTAFAPRKTLLVIGPQIQLAVPRGYFNVALDYSKEWNHNGIIGKDVSFDPAFEVEASWGIPFRFCNTSWRLTGFFNYVAPKGHDGFGAKTKGEILTRPELLLDVGEFFGKKGALEVGIGYEYWLNKFGNDHEKTAGSLAKTPMLIAKVHF